MQYVIGLMIFILSGIGEADPTYDQLYDALMQSESADDALRVIEKGLDPDRLRTREAIEKDVTGFFVALGPENLTQLPLHAQVALGRYLSLPVIQMHHDHLLQSSEFFRGASLDLSRNFEALYLLEMLEQDLETLKGRPLVDISDATEGQLLPVLGSVSALSDTLDDLVSNQRTIQPALVEELPRTLKAFYGFMADKVSRETLQPLQTTDTIDLEDSNEQERLAVHLVAGIMELTYYYFDAIERGSFAERYQRAVFSRAATPAIKALGIWHRRLELTPEDFQSPEEIYLGNLAPFEPGQEEAMPPVAGRVGDSISFVLTLGRWINRFGEAKDLIPIESAGISWEEIRLHEQALDRPALHEQLPRRPDDLISTYDPFERSAHEWLAILQAKSGETPVLLLDEEQRKEQEELRQRKRARSSFPFPIEPPYRFKVSTDEKIENIEVVVDHQDRETTLRLPPSAAEVLDEEWHEYRQDITLSGDAELSTWLSFMRLPTEPGAWIGYRHKRDLTYLRFFSLDDPISETVLKSAEEFGHLIVILEATPSSLRYPQPSVSWSRLVALPFWSGGQPIEGLTVRHLLATEPSLKSQRNNLSTQEGIYRDSTKLHPPWEADGWCDQAFGP